MRIPPSPSANQRGSACLVVVVLLIVMVILMEANSRALHSLDRVLRRIEEKQLRRSGVNATNTVVIPATNAVNAPREHER